MNLINKLKAESDKLVTNDMKNIIKPGPVQKKKPSEIKQESDQTFDDTQSIISDGSSVYSSASAILDSISSIFAIRSAQNAGQP